MHLSTVFSLALALSPLAVLARGNLGYALGSRNPDKSCKSTADYEADFDALSSKGGLGNVKRVRTYAVVDADPKFSNICPVASVILPAAKAKGFQVIQGFSADTEAAYEAEKAALTKVLTTEDPSTIYGLLIGSETLYNGGDACDLLARIVDARSTFGGKVKRVGTVDSWNKFADGTADPIITGKCPNKAPVPGVTFLHVNAFGYWQGVDIQKATATYLDDIQQAIGHIQDLAGLDAVEIMNGETGWPGDKGDNHYSAIAGNKNAETFFKSGVCTMLAMGVDVMYFEAFDERAKPLSKAATGELRNEGYWGAFDEFRTPKFSLACPSYA